ncbi:MAG: helix-turn-helix domain-containing protein [Hyphomonadaceae bacterium]
MTAGRSAPSSPSPIGDKWSVLIITRLGTALKDLMKSSCMIGGISRMLTLTLRNLERDGIISRTVTPTVPPRVDYALTELGRDLLGPVTALGDWAIRHQPCIEAARAQFDEANAAETPQQTRVSSG